MPWIQTRIAGLGLEWTTGFLLVAAQLIASSVSNPASFERHVVFSPVSPFAVSEVAKFSISALLFFIEWRSRTKTSGKHNDEEGLLAYDTEPVLEDESKVARKQALSLSHSKGFIQSMVDELSRETAYGCAYLALVYVLVNNLTLLLFSFTDSEHIRFFGSGITLTTALALIMLRKSSMSGKHWIAVLLQLIGVITILYKPQQAGGLDTSTYVLLLAQVNLTALSSIYHQSLGKGLTGSLHVMNMVLFGCSGFMNIVVQSIVAFRNPEGRQIVGEGQTYHTFVFVLSNAIIGLLVTAVYKYGDVLIKCFSTAISTAIILTFSSILSQEAFSTPTLFGIALVLIATWLYATGGSVQVASQPPSSPVSSNPKSQSFTSKCLYAISPEGPFRKSGLVISTIISLVTTGILMSASPSVTDVPIFSVPTNAHLGSKAPGSKEVWRSPFQNSVAFIRVNRHLPERRELVMQKYGPFFRTVHVSMPADGEFAPNMTDDNWGDGLSPYQPVIHFLNMIKDNPDYKIDGIMYFHFDAWVEPMRFHDMDFEKIWVTTSEGNYICQVKTPDRNPDWVWWNGGLDAVKKSVGVTAHLHPKYDIDMEEFCMGWSDLFFLPLRFFQDFIDVGSVFASIPVFHEIALPTIWNIFDRTYTINPIDSVIYRWADCWGGCCSGEPLPEEILEHRCGHKMNYLAWDVTKVHYTRLTQNAYLLDTPKAKEKQLG